MQSELNVSFRNDEGKVVYEIPTNQEDKYSVFAEKLLQVIMMQQVRYQSICGHQIM